MGRNKKKQSQTIPLVPTSQNKRARRKKAKKLKKNLEGTNSIISNMPSIKVNESKKSKKRRFLKEQQQQQKASVLTNSNVKITNKKRAGFGEASSESDSEPIEADWGSANDHSDNDDEQWQSEENVTRSFTNSNDDDEQSDSGSSDNDLEESEEDEDEELSENELNTLIQSQKKPMTKDTSKQKISGPKKKPLKRTRESVENTPTSAKKMKIVGESKQSTVKPLDKDDDQVSVSYNWTNESIIIEEVKKRAIELSSATLYVSPLPPNHSESMLKSLSPSMVSYRFSIRRNKEIRSFVFLQYVDADTAEAARKAISGRLFAGKTISAQPNRLSFPISDLKLDNINRTQLFVTGFNSSTTKNDLIHIFPKGTVDFPLTKDGMTCGYAIVKFVNENVSLEAFSTTHKRLVRGLPIFVNFIFSRSKVIDQKQNNDENQLKANKSKNDQSLEKMKEKQLNKPSSSSSSLEKTSNKVIQKTTVNTKDIGNKEKGNNTKVLVQQLPESENDSNSSGSDESNDESKTDELLVNQTKNKHSTTSKTSVLNDLVSSKMLKVSPKKKSKSEMSKLDDDDDDDDDDSDGHDDDDDDDDDEEDNEDLDDEDEISEYDEDDSGTEEEDDDVDDDDDDDEDDEDEEDLGDTDSDDASEDSDEVVKNDSKQKNTVNNKNKPSPLKNNSQIISVDEEQASSADSNNSSDEEIDKQLMTVIQAKRNAKKSFKSPKNAKRNFDSAKHSGKSFQPQLLRVPETMKGKKK